MKPFSSHIPYWRPWILAAGRRDLNILSPSSTILRQLSYQSAQSRNVFRNQKLQAGFLSRRWNSSNSPLAQATGQSIPDKTAATAASELAQSSPSSIPVDESIKRDEPAYEITFTCKPCQTRSKHRISKQGYHKGTILITCPDCKNRHLICDHLKIFRDQSTTIEDILKERGELVKRGTLGSEGDIELWDDGTATDQSQKPPGDNASTSAHNTIDLPTP